MAFNLDLDLPRELAPLAWLIGTWQGAGVVGYPTMESANFGQEIVCSHDGRPFLSWTSRTWLLDADGTPGVPSATESGFWRVREDGDIELLLAHPTGIVELYIGAPDVARVQLQTDGVLRSSTAKAYAAAQRMYGLVGGNLMWVMDMAAMDQPMQSHASAELKRVN